MWYCYQRLGLFMFFQKISGGGKRCRGQRPRQRLSKKIYILGHKPIQLCQFQEENS